jgi:hypothetical protein
MRVEVVDDSHSSGPALTFPPADDYVDLRENPHAIERIAIARQYLPLRNFLIAINRPESVFASGAVAATSGPPAFSSVHGAFEFSSNVNLVFAVPSLNLDRMQFVELAENLKQLLERDSSEAVRAELRISPCDFPAQNKRGFCLGVRLAALGDSAKQSELRWGFGLARVQQALLFRARTLGQQIGARDSQC